MGDSATAVIGAGSWGTALAILLARNGWPTLLWARDPARVTEMARSRSNARYLPGLVFPERLELESDLAAVVARTQDLLIVVPSCAFLSTLEQIAELAPKRPRLAWATKGFDPGTGRLLHQVVAEVFPPDTPTAVLSGPTFAAEVARGLPTALTAASAWPDFAATLARRLHNRAFRVYTSEDVVGVQFGGAVKNVFAIAAGITDGLEFGSNARAALVARALAEMIRIGKALGGRAETFMGLAGVGDLVLTCTDDQSRNRRLGLALGRGESMAEAVTGIGQVVEGVGTVKEVMRLAEEHAIEAPITEQVYHVLYSQRTPLQAAEALLMREQKPETP